MRMRPYCRNDDGRCSVFVVISCILLYPVFHRVSLFCTIVDNHCSRDTDEELQHRSSFFYTHPASTDYRQETHIYETHDHCQFRVTTLTTLHSGSQKMTSIPRQRERVCVWGSTTPTHCSSSYSVFILFVTWLTELHVTVSAAAVVVVVARAVVVVVALGGV